jgi:phosphoglycolate phosphatase
LDSVGHEPPSLADCRRFIGDGVEMLVRRALTAALDDPPDPDLVAATLEAFKQCYRNRLFVASRLYPLVDDTLKRIQANGLTIGCVTNKPEGFARELLTLAGIGPYFDFVHGADTFASKKPSPEPLTEAVKRFGAAPGDSVMVGDARNDLESARSAGVDFVFAAYGYAPADDQALRSHRPAIDSFAALARLLCGL